MWAALSLGSLIIQSGNANETKRNETSNISFSFSFLFKHDAMPATNFGQTLLSDFQTTFAKHPDFANAIFFLAQTC